ncbi:MAG: PilN domain-containing protein [Candidatus Poribacteria bacterium]|nr:PilN domain-containing protein [Candidatus Poribacteria bacterium]
MFQWLNRSKSKQEAKARLEQIMEPRDAQTDADFMSHLQIEVNLLPQEYAPQSAFNLRNISYLILSLLILSFLSLNVMGLINQEKTFHQQSQLMQGVLNKYHQLKGEINALKERTALLHERRDLLANAIEERQTWSDKLSLIYNQIPAEVWLTEISLKYEIIKTAPTVPAKDKSKKPLDQSKDTSQSDEPQELVKLNILGDAKDLSRIAELIDRLETFPFLQQIKLSRVNQREESDRLVMSFEIIAEIPLDES